MTLPFEQQFEIPRSSELVPPNIIRPSDITFIIPVKDNQDGISAFLDQLQATHQLDQFAMEVIVVDNNSRVPVKVDSNFIQDRLSIRLLTCSKPGPAAARNVGWRAARGDWVLFTDSDCIPTSTSVTGFTTDANDAIAYMGLVKAAGHDLLSRYYESQRILMPSVSEVEGVQRPAYLVTANALVWKTALEMVGGFNESIQIAAGEDIDLGLRLARMGLLSYAPQAVMLHDFNGGLRGFVGRFIRYGAGNRMLNLLHGLDLRPRRFKARRSTPVNSVLACLQYLSLMVGYQSQAEASLSPSQIL